MNKETFGSIMGTFKEPLNPWINPVIDAANSGDDFMLITVRKKNVSRGRSDRNVSHSEERRALMLPQELKEMNQNEQIILYEGMAHPAKVSKIRYYQDKTFTARLKNNVDMKRLTVN